MANRKYVFTHKNCWNLRLHRFFWQSATPASDRYHAC